MVLRTERAVPDPDWDDFVGSSEHGSHQQSSLWAAVKRTQHWDAFRVIAEEEGGIVGGAQVLHRPVPLVGRIGYIKFGPVMRRPDEGTAAAVLSEAVQEARRSGIVVLYLQAAHVDDEATRSACDALHLRPSRLELSLPMTSVTRLEHPEDAILARMRRSTRRNVRVGLRSGLAVRHGKNSEDVDTFVDLLELTGRRHGFHPESRAFYHELWRWFYPTENLDLILVEKNGEPVAAALQIAFAKTVRCFRGGWSGDHGKLRPNELAIWEGIRWAKAKGYAYFDQDGTRPGENNSASSFKEGFGGDNVRMPPVYEWVRNPLFSAVTLAMPHMGRFGLSKSLLREPKKASAAT